MRRAEKSQKAPGFAQAPSMCDESRPVDFQEPREPPNQYYSKVMENQGESKNIAGTAR
jgi:hypothetical protein